MSNILESAKSTHAAVGRLLSDALGHHSDLRTALAAIERETGAAGTDPISQAVAAYQAATTPAAIRRQVNAGKGRGYDGLITPAVVRRSAADALREVLESEVAR